MTSTRYTRFDTVIVGGSGGRTPYNVKTYLRSIPLQVKKPATSGRHAQPFDDEYSLREKAGAHSHYMETLMHYFGFHGGRFGKGAKERPLSKRLIVILNRETESNGRVIRNTAPLLKARVCFVAVF